MMMPQSQTIYNIIIPETEELVGLNPIIINKTVIGKPLNVICLLLKGTKIYYNTHGPVNL